MTLIQGETGTGKEVIARVIHNQSLRNRGPFVKLNCAAIPGPLLESELFGHERGAFTGAFAQTNGRFQLADKGTLFLDEIGDLPLELQPKLLRALQEQEFERLGSSRTIRVDVRVVAATNQNLSQLVATKQFRADLYYRLNVIPIFLPPLRERAQDIPLLVEHFVRKLSARLNKPIDSIPDEVIQILKAHDWPGNILSGERVATEQSNSNRRWRGRVTLLGNSFGAHLYQIADYSAQEQLQRSYSRSWVYSRMASDFGWGGLRRERRPRYSQSHDSLLDTRADYAAGLRRRLERDCVVGWSEIRRFASCLPACVAG
jgi:transcriptional regulator with GAF, ATPase, and Fis domain